jgi:hypothetical protein
MPKATQAAKNRRNARRTAAKPTVEATVATAAAKVRTPRNAKGQIVAKSTVKAAAKKAVTVKMKGADETTNTWKFVYSGTAKEPFVKALYITKDALDTLADGPLTVVFKPYVQQGKQKPMPMSAIRYSGDPETIRDLYVNRAQAESKGFSNGSKVSVTITVVNDDTISLAVSVA